MENPDISTKRPKTEAVEEDPTEADIQNAIAACETVEKEAHRLRCIVYDLKDRTFVNLARNWVQRALTILADDHELDEIKTHNILSKRITCAILQPMIRGFDDDNIPSVPIVEIWINYESGEFADIHIRLMLFSYHGEKGDGIIECCRGEVMVTFGLGATGKTWDPMYTTGDGNLIATKYPDTLIDLLARSPPARHLIRRLMLGLVTVGFDASEVSDAYQNYGDLLRSTRELLFRHPGKLNPAFRERFAKPPPQPFSLYANSRARLVQSIPYEGLFNPESSYRGCEPLPDREERSIARELELADRLLSHS